MGENKQNAKKRMKSIPVFARAKIPSDFRSRFSQVTPAAHRVGRCASPVMACDPQASLAAAAHLSSL
jgi:hypothetical protein